MCHLVLPSPKQCIDMSAHGVASCAAMPFGGLLAPYQADKLQHILLQAFALATLELASSCNPPVQHVIVFSLMIPTVVNTVIT